MAYKMSFFMVYVSFVVMPLWATDTRQINRKICDEEALGFDYFIKSTGKDSMYRIINNSGEKIQVYFYNWGQVLGIGQSVSFDEKQLKYLKDKKESLTIYSLKNEPEDPPRLGKIEPSYFRIMGNYTITRKTIKPKTDL